MKISLKTSDGHFLSAVNGGNMGDPVGMPENSIPFHTNATEHQAWETFKFVPQGGKIFALQTSSGNFVTAVNGGNMGDPTGMPFNSIPLHTNATDVSAWETFEMIPVSPQQDRFALKTSDGHFVTAVNGGNMGDPAGQPANSWPLHTNATEAKDWEKFEVNAVIGANRKRSLSSDLDTYIPLAQQLAGEVGGFREEYGTTLAALRSTITNRNAPMMTRDTQQQFERLVGSGFVQQARNRLPSNSRTYSFAFGVEGSVGFGAALAAGIAFDTSFSRYMRFETLAGSAGLQAGASTAFRMGFYDFDVFSFNGFSDSLEVDIGAGLGAGLTLNYNWWDGWGGEFSFGAGLELGGSFSIGYSFDTGHGTI